MFNDEKCLKSQLSNILRTKKKIQIFMNKNLLPKKLWKMERLTNLSLENVCIFLSLTQYCKIKSYYFS